MTDLSPTPHDPGSGPARRTVLAGAGAAAVAAAALATAVPAAASPTRQAPRAADSGAPTSQTLVAHVRPGSRDEVTVYVGDREVTVTDRGLVRALMSAATSAEGTR